MLNVVTEQLQPVCPNLTGRALELVPDLRHLIEVVHIQMCLQVYQRDLELLEKVV